MGQKDHPTNTQTAPDDTMPLDSTKVLIVDHNPVMSRIISHILVRAKLEYAIANNGGEAITFCQDTDYDIVLMEVTMPGSISGLEAAKKIKALSEHYNTVPIIAVSTRMGKNDIEEYRNSGMNTEIKKPINEMNLMRVLEQQLNITIHAAHRAPPEDDEIYALLDQDEMSLLNWDTINEYNLIMKSQYKDIMKKFLTISPDLIGDMGEAVIAKDSQTIEKLAHQLKSTSLIFGAETMSNIAAELETLGHANDLEHAGQFYKELHMSFERVQPVLRKKLALLYNAH